MRVIRPEHDLLDIMRSIVSDRELLISDEADNDIADGLRLEGTPIDSGSILLEEPLQGLDAEVVVQLEVGRTPSQPRQRHYLLQRGLLPQPQGLREALRQRLPDPQRPQCQEHLEYLVEEGVVGVRDLSKEVDERLDSEMQELLKVGVEGRVCVEVLHADDGCDHIQEV